MVKVAEDHGCRLREHSGGSRIDPFCHVWVLRGAFDIILTADAILQSTRLIKDVSHSGEEYRFCTEGKTLE